MAASQFKAEWPTFALCSHTHQDTVTVSKYTRTHIGDPTSTHNYTHTQMHIDLHTTLSLRTNAFAVSCGQVCRNWKEQPRASPQTRRTEPGALHWQPAINTNDCSLRSRWHPRHHPCNTPAHTYKRLPPAPSLSFLRHLSLWFLPQFVTTVTPLTGKPVIASEMHVPSANARIHAHTHLRSCMHAKRGGSNFFESGTVAA